VFNLNLLSALFFALSFFSEINSLLVVSLPLLYPKIHQMFPTKFDFGCINIYFPKKRFIDPSMLAHGKVKRNVRYVQVDVVTMLLLILY